MPINVFINAATSYELAKVLSALYMPRREA